MAKSILGWMLHQATTIAAVRDAGGKLESVLETKSEVLLQFLAGLRGSLHVTLEEGTWAAWLYDLLRPQEFWRRTSSSKKLFGQFSDNWAKIKGPQCTVLF